MQMGGHRVHDGGRTDTKQMTPETLAAAINSDTWSLQPPVESNVRKHWQRAARMNQQRRRSNKYNVSRKRHVWK